MFGFLPIRRDVKDFANNFIAYLHGHHLNRHDSHTIARKAGVEDLEEAPHICFKEELLHIAVAGEPMEDEISTELSRRQPMIQAVGQIYTYDSGGWSNL